jgi:hypothetical protein
MAISLYGQNKQGSKINELIDDVRVYNFEHAPIVSDAQRLGAAAKLLDGSTEEQISLQFPDGLNLNCAYMGGCGVDGPSGTSEGMTWEQADTNNLGYQFVMCHKNFKGIEGIDSYTIGSAAFYMKHKFKIGNVSGLDYCMAGFRLKSQTHVADPKATYTDYACLDVNAGNIYAETALNDSTATPTDTTDNWIDGETHELEVYVSAAGVATFKIDGVAPTVNTHSVTFDNADVVTPFFVGMKGAAEAADIIHIRLEVGLQ